MRNAKDADAVDDTIDVLGDVSILILRQRICSSSLIRNTKMVLAIPLDHLVETRHISIHVQLLIISHSLERVLSIRIEIYRES